MLGSPDDFLQITSVLIVLAGVFGAINDRYLRLPAAIGILVVSLIASFVLLGLGLLAPDPGIAGRVRVVATGIDFSEVLLEGMLGLLLFAGALHVKVGDLRDRWRAVFLMATVGITLSTVIVGAGFSWLTGKPMMVAIVFGALIWPTDPVAVLNVLRKADLPKALETKIAAVSLFNDGAGYVVDPAFPQASGHGAAESAPGGAVLLFLREAMGGDPGADAGQVHIPRDAAH